jgi:FkbM family methyltransferase
MPFDRSIPKFDFRFVRSPTSLLKGLRHDLFYTLLHKHMDKLEDLGDPTFSCNWTICTRGLGPNSVVYSAGVGKDISFEHSLADKFGVQMLLLDPSPTGMETMALAANQRAEFEFLPVGLAGKPGELILAPPGNPDEGSWMAGELSAESSDHMIKVPCESVESLMKRYNHKRIDLLKMDIEGAEFEVLDSILDSGIEISQIAVEFHNAVLEGVPRGRTINSLTKLWKHGYRVIHKGGSNHTLLHLSQF